MSRSHNVFAMAVSAFVLATRMLAADVKADDPMVQELKPLQNERFEARFLGLMIHHHESGIKMAELAVERAKTDKVREFAQKMIPTQKKEIAKMSGWLSTWHKKSPDDVSMPAESQKQSAKDMENLRAMRGEDFDRTFLKLMSKHHRSAVEMADLARDRVEHRPVAQLAVKIHDSQEKEIGQMKSWLASLVGPAAGMASGR